jgi:hypothetical protein
MVGRHPDERQRETLDKNKERDEEMPKMVFVALQIFHTVLPARSMLRGLEHRTDAHEILI